MERTVEIVTDPDDEGWGYGDMPTGVLGGVSWATRVLVYSVATVAAASATFAALAAVAVLAAVLTANPDPVFGSMRVLVPAIGVTALALKASGGVVRRLARLWVEETTERLAAFVFDRAPDVPGVTRGLARVMRAHAVDGLDGARRYPQHLAVFVSDKVSMAQGPSLRRATTSGEIARNAATAAAAADKESKVVRPPVVRFVNDPTLRAGFVIGFGDMTEARWAPTQEHMAGEVPVDDCTGLMGLTFDNGRTVWVKRETELGRSTTGRGRIEGDPTTSGLHAIADPGEGSTILLTVMTGAHTLVNGRSVFGTVTLVAGDKVTFGSIRATVRRHPTSGRPADASPIQPTPAPIQTPGAVEESATGTRSAPQAEVAESAHGTEDIVPESAPTPEADRIRSAILDTWLSSPYATTSDENIARRSDISVNRVKHARDLAARLAANERPTPLTLLDDAYRVTRGVWQTQETNSPGTY